MLANPRGRPVQLVVGFAIAALLFYAYHSYTHSIFGRTTLRPATPPPPDSEENDDLNTHARANATLGFGAIIAVSREGSPRRHALEQAANVTEIEIVIPPQPKWGDADIEHFKNAPDSDIRPGSVLAWLGHNNALQWFLDSGLETALILEDDVDWDIHLRSLQVPLAAHAARSVLGLATPTKEMNYYWGDPITWDLLYLGHCGDYFGRIEDGIGPGIQKPEMLQDIPHEIFKDQSLPDDTNLHPWTADFLRAVDIPEKHRAFHRSRFPLCTFGYAVSRPAAWKLVNVLAPAQERPPEEHGPKAFDIAVLHACVDGFMDTVHGHKPEGLRCYTVNPELFHHKPGDSEIAGEDEKKGRMDGIPPVDFAGAEQVKIRHETSNIGCGFWGAHFSFPDGNKRKLDYLQTNVGRGGKCLKPGRDKLEAF